MSPRPTMVALLALLLPLWAACTDAAAPAAPRVPDALAAGLAALPRPAAEARAWLPGDTHVHTHRSTDAGAQSTPELVRMTAIREGLGWVLLSDHSNATGSQRFCLDHPEPNDCVEQDHLHNLGPEFPLWTTAAGLSDETLLMVDGNEASPVSLSDTAPRGHVNIVPADLEAFARMRDWIVVDRPMGAVTGGWAIGAAHRHGALAILNHPYSPGGVTPWIEYDWTALNYDAVEVYNAGGGWDDGDQVGLAAAWCDWVQGRPVALVGASDNHRTDVAPPGELLDPALGSARTSALVAAPSWAAIVAALRARHTIAHDKHTFVELRLTVGAQSLLPGDVAALPAGEYAATIELGGWTSEPATVEVLELSACDDGRARGAAREIELTQRVLVSVPLAAAPPAAGGAGGQQTTHEIVVRAGTVVAAWVRRDWNALGQRGQALPTPIALRAAP